MNRPRRGEGFSAMALAKFRTLRMWSRVQRARWAKALLHRLRVRLRAGKGRPPSGELVDDLNAGAGKTLCVGNRKNGKLLHIYEKGRPPESKKANPKVWRSSSAGQSSRVGIVTGWSMLASAKMLTIERCGGRTGSGIDWAGLRALRIPTAANPRACTGVPSSD